MDDPVFAKYCYDNFDVDGNGKVSREEAAEVSQIELNVFGIYDKPVFSLKGIGYFPNLRTLYCWGNGIRSVDLSHNTELVALALGNDQTLSQIDLYRNRKLTDMYRAFVGCSNLECVRLPENLSEIGPFAFNDCSKLTGINLPKSITAIGAYAFDNCSALTGIVLPEKLSRIEPCIFFDCKQLANVTIPQDVVYIGEFAFHGCGLTEIDLPEGVAFVGESALDCPDLQVVRCRATTPPDVSRKLCEDKVAARITLYVPAASIDRYRKSDIWRNFGRIQPL